MTKKKSEKGVKKSKKDESKVKRPVSAFMYFSQEKRPELKKNNPSMGFGDLGKKLGEMWHALKDEEKKPFLQKAAKDKERYEAEKAK